MSHLRYDAIDDCDAITAAKQVPRRTILRGARADVSDRFERYISLSAMLERIAASPFVAPINDMLLHCYVVETVPLSRLKVRIREAQPSPWQNLCPYCGIDSSRTFDHFLCKENFPEFSMLHVNLIPSCGVCNGYKGTRELEGGRRNFVHFYFDSIPDLRRWLHCRLEVTSGLPEAVFWLDCPPEIGPELTAVLESHYEKLHLLSRFRGRAAQTLSETMSLAGRLAAEDYAASFALQSTKWATLYGANYWECVLYDAMAQSETFLALLST